jgi:hypothetical protein
MKNILKIILLLLILSYSASAKTHVFWYKVLTNNYPITDCNPGPCLDNNATFHEGIIASGTVAQHSGSAEHSLVFGSGLDDQQGRCGFIWSKELNEITGTVTSAKVRAEYRDGWAGNALCNAGPINIRCGVVDFQGNLDTWGGADYVPETADWQDFLNPLSSSMGYDFMTPTLQVEEIISFQAPAGRQSEFDPSVLDGKFFEVDITDQVNWILANSGSYAIVLLVPPNEGNTGKVTTYSAEDGTGTQWLGGDNPWTTDGNTAHIVMGIGPSIVSMSPDSGDVAGGDTVIISGLGFDYQTNVYFGTAKSQSVTLKAGPTLQVLVPPSLVSGHVDVIVANGSETDTLKAGFEYIITGPPVFTSSPDTFILEDSLFAYVMQVRSDWGTGVTYSLASGPPGMFVSVDTLIWRPNDSHVGSHSVIVQANNNQGQTAGQSFTVQVINTPDDPVFSRLIPSGDTTIREGDTLVFSASAYDPDNMGGTMIYYWFLNREYVGADTTFTLITDLSSAGQCSVRVLVFDGHSQSEHVWRITVNNLSIQPEITRPEKHGAVNSDSIISWQVFPDPDLDTNSILYSLEFSTNSSFAPVIKRIDSLQDYSYKISELVDAGDLPELSVIFVRVMAFDNKGYTTAFSDSSMSFLFLNYIGIEESDRDVPQDYVLYPNRPNPFNPSTFIRFGVPDRVDKMVFRIFDIKGGLVRTINKYSLKPGYYTVTWDGRDSRGGLCQNGVYICKVQCDKFQKSIKMTMIK